MAPSITQSGTPVTAEPYIKRDETERALRLVEEGVVPVVQVWGVGGAGKSRTLTEVERRFAQTVRSARMSFGLTEGRDGKFITEPIALMGHLFKEIDSQDGMLGDWGDASEFSTLYDRYYETLEKLKMESPEGGKADGEQKSLVESVAQIGKGLGEKYLGEGNGEMVEQGIGMVGRFSSLLRSHRSTKKDAALQALMQNPLPKLTEAFISSLKAKAKRLPIALLLDTYEKAGTEVDRWLCGVLGNGDWAGVQFVVAGRHRLSGEEHWRKLEQDMQCLREFGLGAFSRSQTEEYVGAIGLGTRSDEIYGVTKGLPYYLNWIWKRKLSGERLDFGAGNEEIVQLLLQGLNDGQRRLIELMACGRSFDRSTVKRLMGCCELEGLPERDLAFGWLKNLSFVESVGRGYRLDNVARDVFRLGLFLEDGAEFRRLNRLWAEDCLGQSEAIVEPEEPLSEQYGHPEWRTMRGNYLYHLALCGKKREVVAVWQKHLLEARYFLESDMLNLPLLDELKELLEYRIREFLVEIRPVMVAGYAVLEKLPIDDAYNQQEYGFSRGELDRSVQICLAEVEKLEGLAKFSGLLCLAQRVTEAKRLECLKQAQDMTEELLEDESLEFASNLFLYKLGNAFHELKAYEEAIVSYDTAIGIKPYHCDAWNNRGVSLAALGREEEAIISYDKAIEFKPNDHTAWNNRGVSLNDLGCYEEGLISCDKAIEFKSNYDDAWYNRGNSLASLGRHEEAIDSDEKAIEIKPDKHEAWYNRGTSLDDLGRKEEAIASYEKAIGIKPDLHEAWSNRGVSLAALGRHEEAIDSYDKAIEIKPDDNAAWSNCGVSLAALDRKGEAIDSYDKAIEIKPDDHAAWNNRGISLDALGREQEAIDSYDKAIEFKPDYHEAWYARGNSLYELGRKEEAIASYDKAIELKPDYANAFYKRACCYSLMGNLELALEDLTIAFRLDPEEYRQLATIDTDLDPLRELPDFIALMELII